jgi:pyruvate,orthophosphate dikinase
MPGMLDTVLNLGLNDEAVEGLGRVTGDRRFAWDCYRRLVQMFGTVTQGIPAERFEQAIDEVKRRHGAGADTDLDVDALRALTELFQAIYRAHTGEGFPQDPLEQLDRAVRAVFDSWTGARAVAYRRREHIPDSWGTAVNIQQMVFGNRSGLSASGVAFSRDEMTGAPSPSGDFLPNAQGEDVVSGVRTPLDLGDLATWSPTVHAELLDVLTTLERHYGDMQDTEFTIEDGRLHMLQTRTAKRPAQGAVRFAVDAVAEGLLTREEALLTIDAASLDALLHPTLDSSHLPDELVRGTAASPGAAQGEIVLRAEDAIAAAERGRSVILVRPFTDAEDVAGFHAARGVLTVEGGKASHAALVARGMGRPAVVGAQGLTIDLQAGTVATADTTLGSETSSPSTARAAASTPARCRSSRSPSIATSSRSSAGPTTCAGSAYEPTPTRPRTPPAPGPWARAASACAARSTCSWRPTASRRCAR